MLWVWITIGIIAIFFLLLVITPTKIKIKASIINEDVYVLIALQLLFGCIRFEKAFQTTTKQLEKMKEHKGKKPKDKKEVTKKAKKEAKKEAKLKEHTASEWLSFIQRGIAYILSELKFIHLYEFKWQTEYGLGHAGYTGMVVGHAWTVKAWLLQFFYSYLTVHEPPKINVIPAFQIKGVRSRLECMFTFKIGKAIAVGIGIVKRWLIFDRKWPFQRQKRQSVSKGV